MSNNRLVLRGMDELRASLRQLPAELAAEAGHIVIGAGNGAVAEIKAGYDVHTGNLRDHVTSETRQIGPFGVAVRVKSTARHAHLYEYGTQTRQTRLGWNRGAMPPRPTFVPAMQRARRRMYEQLKDLLRRAGLVVRGEA